MFVVKVFCKVEESALQERKSDKKCLPQFWYSKKVIESQSIANVLHRILKTSFVMKFFICINQDVTFSILASSQDMQLIQLHIYTISITTIIKTFTCSYLDVTFSILTYSEDMQLIRLHIYTISITIIINTFRCSYLDVTISILTYSEYMYLIRLHIYTISITKIIKAFNVAIWM